MNKHNQHGFGLAGVIVIILAVIGLGFIIFRVITSQETGSNTASQPSQTKKDDLQLQNFGLASLDSVLVSNQALREYASNGLKGFYPFGDTLGNTGRINPNFEFASLKPGTKVVSAINGTVVFIKDQPESSDSEVFLQPFEGSAWMVGYDHISNVAVKKGDVVQAGDVLGEPTAQGNGQLRFELQINKKQAGDELSYCPSNLLDPAVKDKQLQDLAAMMQQWETQSGLDLYDAAAQNPAGCLAETVKP